MSEIYYDIDLDSNSESDEGIEVLKDPQIYVECLVTFTFILLIIYGQFIILICLLLILLFFCLDQ